MPPLFGIWVENLGRKTDWIWLWPEWRPFFLGLHLNLDRRTGWIWVKTFVIFIFLIFMFLIWFLSTFSNFWLRAWPLLSKILRTPLEQGSATYIPWAVSGPRSQTSVRYPLCDFRKSLVTQPNPALKLPQHLTKTFFFLRVLNNKSAKNYLKIWWIPFFYFYFLSNDSKTCKIVFKWS